MDAQQIIEYIRTSPKTTPVRVWLQTSQPVDFPGAQQFFGGNGFSVVFGDWEKIRPVLEENQEKILLQQVENDARNSAIPLLDKKRIHARIEPGAIIREQVQIGDNAVIMMGAILNIGAVIGEETMIDMGAVLGGRATVGRRCHIGAGAVLAGVVEPPSAQPVVVEDDVLIGANCRRGVGGYRGCGPRYGGGGGAGAGHQKKGRKIHPQNRAGQRSAGACRAGSE